MGWTIPKEMPHLFAWGLDNRKMKGLTELEQIELNDKYHRWTVDVGCANCKLHGEMCSGLKAKSMVYSVEGERVIVNNYEADFDENALWGTSYTEFKKIIKEGAVCKPKER